MGSWGRGQVVLEGLGCEGQLRLQGQNEGQGHLHVRSEDHPDAGVLLHRPVRCNPAALCRTAAGEA